jgi:hypothetical protein
VGTFCTSSTDLQAFPIISSVSSSSNPNEEMGWGSYMGIFTAGWWGKTGEEKEICVSLKLFFEMLVGIEVTGQRRFKD